MGRDLWSAHTAQPSASEGKDIATDAAARMDLQDATLRDARATKGQTPGHSTYAKRLDQPRARGQETGRRLPGLGGRDAELAFHGVSVLQDDRGLEKNGDRLRNNVNVLNATEVYTLTAAKMVNSMSCACYHKK